MRYEDASGTFQASGPIANDDSDTLTAGSRGPATGNLITGEGTQYGSAGADSAAGAQVTAIAGKGGEDSSFAGGKLSVTGEFGQLSVDADGNYSYLANTGAPENVRDRFVYTLADDQGNSDTAALIVEIGKTPVVIKADAQQIVPGPDGVVTLPPGVELSDIMVVGRNLVVNMPDGTQLIIIDGAIFVPQLVLGGVEVPATNVAALLIGQEVQPAAGETPPSSGGNFAVPPPPLDPGVPLGDLIPPTEYNYIPPEPQEVFPEEDDEDPEILIQPDGQPASVAAVDEVDERGLPTRNGGEPEGTGEGADGNPSNDSDTSEATAGTIIINSPDGVDSVTIAGADGIPHEIEVGLVVQGEYGTLTITGVVGDDYTYSYVLDDNIDHSDGAADQDDFSVVLTDEDGDTASATLTINILDDVPTAVDDTDTIAAGEFGPATGNVLTDADAGDADDDDDGADTVGADDAELTNVTGFGDTEAVEGGWVVQGQYGVLTIGADGSYSYVRNEGTPGGVEDVFTYTLTDGDTDTDTATLTITIEDATPETGENPTVLLDDDALENGNPGTPDVGDDVDAANVTGFLAGSGGDGPLTFDLLLTGAPEGFSYVDGPDGAVHVMQGTTHVLTVTIDAATGEYEVSQINPIDHAAGGLENNAPFTINYTVTDQDDDSAPGTLTINVDDDTPVVTVELDRQGAVTVDESGPTGASTIEFTGDEGDDGDVDGSGPIGRAVGSTAVVQASALFGADGPAADAELTYALALGSADTDLTLTDGSAIELQLIDGVVVGVVTEGDHEGDAAFAIAINPDTGVATVELYLSLDHPDDTNPNDSLPLGPNTVSVVVSATDSDNDTVESDPVDISGLFNFLDDGPTADGDANSAGAVTVDESGPTSASTIEFTGDEGDDGDVAGSGPIGRAVGTASVVANASAAFGADGPAADAELSYTLALGSEDTDLTLTDGSAIELQLIDGVVVGVVTAGDHEGEAAFAIAINPTTGVATVELYLSLDHPDVNDPNDSLPLGPNTVDVVVTATDGDGDTADSDPIDISGLFNFLDDGPTASGTVNAQGAVTVDESGPTGASTIEFTGDEGDDGDVAGSGPIGRAVGGTAVVNGSALFGADGPAADAELTYALALGSADTDLTLTDGSAIELQLIDGVVVGVVTEGDHDGEAAFAIAINPDTGIATVELYLSLDHPVNPNPNDSLPLGPNTVSVVVTATDGDGDTDDSAPVDISALFNFLDDGPTVEAELDREGAVTVDESGPTGASTIEFTGDEGDDGDVDGSGPIGRAVGSTAVVDASALFGADGPLTEDLGYALQLGGTDTDLTLTDGSAIELQLIDGVVVGMVTEGDHEGEAAFAIAVNPTTGVATVELYLSLDHPDDTNPNDSLPLGPNTVSVVVSATDGDGDTAESDPVDISGLFNFLDDGPTADGDANSAGAVTVDESGPTGASTIEFTGDEGDDGDVDGSGPIGRVVGSASVVANAGAAFGADGPSGDDLSYALALGSEDTDLTLTDGSAIELQLIDGVVVGMVTEGDHDGEAAFAIAINPATGVATVELYLSLDHPLNPNPNDSLPLGPNTISVVVTATDGDGDTDDSDPIDISGLFNFLDDGPVANDDVDTIVGGVGPATGNVITGEELAGDDNTTDGTADDAGADGGAAVVGVAAGDTDTALINAATVGVEIDGQYGKLTLNADGSYSYLRDAESPGGVEDVFTYTLTDGDGDTVTATLTIGIEDNFPTLPDPAAINLDDDVIPGENGNADGPGDDNPDAPDDNVVGGQLNGTGGDAPLTYNFTGSNTLPPGFSVDLVNSDDDTLIIVQDQGGSDVPVLTVQLDQSDGSFTVTQNNPISHDPTNPGAGVGQAGNFEDDLTFLVGVEVEDNDGDVEPATITINVDDDTPVVSNVQGGASVTLDETAAGSPAGFPIDATSLTAVITATKAFGADGPAAVGDTVYGLSLANGAVIGTTLASGLQTAIGNHPITLTLTSATTITGTYTDGGTQTAFTITMNNDGTVTVEQNVPLEHLVDGSSAAAHDDSLDLVIDGVGGTNLINATITIEDADGDTHSGSTPIGDQIVFKDDGPVSEVNAQVGVPTVTLDETRPEGDDGDDGDGAPAGLASVTVGFAGKFLAADYGADGAGTTTYALLLSADGAPSGLYALDNTDTTETVGDGYGQGAPILLFSEPDGSVTGRTVDGGDIYFTISVNGSGQVTFTQNLNVWHSDTGTDDDSSGLSAAGETLQLQQTVTDSDGDFDTAEIDLSDGVFFIEDDGPEVHEFTDAVGENTGTTPTAEGIFDFDIGTDSPNGGDDEISIDPSTFTVSVNGVPIDPADITFTEGPEDADSAEFGFSFDYETGEGGTATAEGTLVFDKDAGTYTVTLTSGPIEGFSVASVQGGSDPQFYTGGVPSVGNGEVAVVEIADGFFMQFTGRSGVTGSSGTFGHDETFGGGTAEDVDISSSQIGVHGNTVQDEDVMDFNFYSSDPGGTPGGTPTASAGTAFLQLGQLNGSEDMVLVLKLADPDNIAGTMITRTIIVQPGDIITSAVPGYPTLANGEGFVIIEPNDYLSIPGVGADYEIVGMQIRTSNEGLASENNEVYNWNGALGAANTVATNFAASDNDNENIKVVDIGAAITTTEDQSATIEFDVTIIDADGDSQTTSLSATIGEPATTLAATSFSAQDEQVQKSAANSNTLTLAAAVAAAGMAESAAASPPADDQSLQVESDQSVSSQQVDMQLVDGGDESSSSVSSLADTFKAETASGETASRGRGDEHRSDNSLDAASNSQPSDDNSSHQAANDQGPAVSQAATPVAPDVAMVSAEMLIAAGLTGGTAKHNNIEEILVDALGQGGVPTVDGLLAQLPGGLGELAAIANPASPATGGVPGWDMAMHGGSGFAADVLVKLDAAMLQHHDAVQPVING